MNDSTMKHCSKCGVLKPLSEFHKNKNFPDGHQYKCKECARQTAREHHQANREKHTEQMREYKKTLAGKSAFKAARARIRAKKLDADGIILAEDVFTQYERQEGKCFYCGKIVGLEFHLDHKIPLSRGGSNNLSNVVITCAWCNLHKRTKLPHEWANM